MRSQRVDEWHEIAVALLDVMKNMRLYDNELATLIFIA
jgi:hypothetical protein